MVVEVDQSLLKYTLFSLKRQFQNRFQNDFETDSLN